MNIGENIKKYRKQKKLTQPELAALINKSESSIQKYESGAVVPDIKTLTSISDALGVPLSDLLQNTDYQDLTNMNKEEVDTYQNFLAPVDNYQEYIETLKKLGFDVITHVGKYTAYEDQTEGFIYDILRDKKVILTLDLNSFCSLCEKVSQYKETFEKSLNLLVNDTISNWKFLYEISEKEDEE